MPYLPGKHAFPNIRNSPTRHEIPSGPWQTPGCRPVPAQQHRVPYCNRLFQQVSHHQTTAKPLHQRSRNQPDEEYIFSEHGVPTKLVTDNGPQLTSEAFRKFAQDWCLDHITSSPRHTKSNGFVERQIRTTRATLGKPTSTLRACHALSPHHTAHPQHPKSLPTPEPQKSPL